METKQVFYLTYAEAVWLHISLMHVLGETRFGDFSRSLVESALARPKQAAHFENADLLRQAATLLYGLIKNHPWVGGNKRTATVLVEYFLFRNGMELAAPQAELIEAVLAVESDRWDIKEIDEWLRRYSKEVTEEVVNNNSEGKQWMIVSMRRSPKLTPSSAMRLTRKSAGRPKGLS